MTKPCIICGEPIPEARLEIGGNRIKTCSTKCRDENIKRQARDGMRRFRARRKERTMNWIVDTLALLPWWGWLLIYLAIALPWMGMSEEWDKRRLKETGLQPDYDGQDKLATLLTALYVGLVLAIETAGAS